MKTILKSILKNNPIIQLYGLLCELRKSLTLYATVLFYLMTSLIIPIIITFGLIVSHILGVGLGFDWYIDSLQSYYYDGEIYGTNGIPSWRGHLLWLFLCWLFSIVIQD